LPKTPSVLSSPNISIVSSKSDFSRNSEEEKKRKAIDEAIDYIKKVNQEQDLENKAIYAKRIPAYLNRVPEQDRESILKMVR